MKMPNRKFEVQSINLHLALRRRKNFHCKQFSFLECYGIFHMYVLSLGSRAITVYTYYLKRQVCKIAVFYQHETTSLPKYMHACMLL